MVGWRIRWLIQNAIKDFQYQGAVGGNLPPLGPSSYYVAVSGVLIGVSLVDLTLNSITEAPLQSKSGHHFP